MNHLVGSVVLTGGETVNIIWSNKTKTKAVYHDTYGYNHMFITEYDKEIRLSNHYMRLKAIKIEKV